jgi:hypothetical protein
VSSKLGCLCVKQPNYRLPLTPNPTETGNHKLTTLTTNYMHKVNAYTGVLSGSTLWPTHHNYETSEGFLDKLHTFESTESGTLRRGQTKLTAYFQAFHTVDSCSQSILLFQLNAHNTLNTYIYHQLPPTCFGFCYTIFRETIALFAQKCYKKHSFLTDAI